MGKSCGHPPRNSRLMMTGVTLTNPPTSRWGFCVIIRGMHRRTQLGLSWVLLGIVIAVLHFLANAYYLYWALWWADIVMHFLGGLFVALGTLWLIRFEVPVSWRHRVPFFFTTLTAVFVVGAGWEVFERAFDVYGATNYALDTTLDLVMDVAGMLAAYLVFKRLTQE